MMNLNKEISNAFNAHATDYEQAAKMQQVIGDCLFERLDYLKITPRYILDLGCGPGHFSKSLQKRYPKAQVVGLDIAFHMLKQANLKQSWRQKWSLVNGDILSMPFASGLFDLVFANQVIHWSPSMSALFRELNRVMNVNGCLMFSTLGPDTFRELHPSQDERYAHTNDFSDMHDIGDCLMNEYFLDPVMDRENLTAHYASFSQLIRSLKAQGVRNIHSSRNPGLTGKHAWHRFEKAVSAFQTAEGKFPLTYEVLYGHAWKGEQRRLDKGTETFVPISQIGKTFK